MCVSVLMVCLLLSTSDCELKDGAATALGKSLMVNTGLEDLDLSDNNEITDVGVRALLEGLESNICLTGTYAVCDFVP